MSDLLCLICLLTHNFWNSDWWPVTSFKQSVLCIFTAHSLSQLTSLLWSVLSCHRKLHMKWTSFKWSSVLKDHFFFNLKGDLLIQVWLYIQFCTESNNYIVVGKLFQAALKNDHNKLANCDRECAVKIHSTDWFIF
jgi:hypothetical protein